MLSRDHYWRRKWLLIGQFGGFGKKVVVPAVVCTESFGELDSLTLCSERRY